jgi:putative cardiolipin synthase
MTRGWIGIAAVALLAACGEVPVDYPREPSTAFEDTEDTYFGRALATHRDAHPGESGFFLLLEGPDALVSRIRGAGRAERSIDVQYYFVLPDSTSYLFAQSLLEAADRGVRVRILLDDINVSGREVHMAGLDTHPNIELRIFNPFGRRQFRWLDFVTDLDRVNHRMHNKSMTIDNQVTIVGGRNIGDEYFGARGDVNFGDADVIGFGPVAKEVSRSFDDYWNSGMAIPVVALVPAGSETESLEALRERWAAKIAEIDLTPFRKALEEVMIEVGERGADLLSWSSYLVVADPPEKVLEGASPTDPELLRSRLGPLVREAERELIVISPYFVPRDAGVALFRDLRDRGVRVVVVTNSLASTDVTAVHAGYARYRKQLLEMGVELWEIRTRRTLQTLQRLQLGMSRSSLHTKAFLIDREELFIGSFNWDPRSVEINTEMGIVLHSPELAAQAGDELDASLSSAAFELRLNQEDEIEWVFRSDGTEMVFDHEPGTGLGRRLAAGLFSLLPIEDQL